MCRRHLPFLLTTLRLALAPLILLSARDAAPHWLLLAILTAAFLSDIFDGLLARRLGVASPALRRYDSATDVIFYAAVLFAIHLLRPGLLSTHLPAIALLLALEAACHAVSLARFHRLPATHSYLAKAWGLVLFLACSAILCFGAGDGAVTLAAGLGSLADAEALAILLLSRRPPVDVPSVWHALRSDFTRAATGAA